MSEEQLSSAEILKELERLKPWHMAIQLTEDVNTASPFSDQHRLLPHENDGVSLLDMRDHLLNPIDRIFPGGLTGKRFLDCACNAGGYSFWAKERGIDETFGFDVRSHWIEQAEFVKRTRTVAPTDNMTFTKRDLYDVPQLNLPKFNITMFKGLFYHLPQPVLGLKIAADLTSELLWFNSAYRTDQPDGFLAPTYESTEGVMSGVHKLAWLPTGPAAIGIILEWLGFKHIRLVYAAKYKNDPIRGRMEILASRDPKLLGPIAADTKRLSYRYSQVPAGFDNSPLFDPAWIMPRRESWFQRLRRMFVKG